MKFAMLRIRKIQKVMILQESGRFLNRKDICPQWSKYGIFHVRPYGGRWCASGRRGADARSDWSAEAPFFLTRREMGIYNVGPGRCKSRRCGISNWTIKKPFTLGSGDRVVTFESKDAAILPNSISTHWPHTATIPTVKWRKRMP